MVEAIKTAEAPPEETPAAAETTPPPDDVQTAPAVATASGSEPGDPWKKVRKLALKQLDRFMSLEPKVLRGDNPDAIHDLRVASRRLQQVLDLLYPPPGPAEVRKLRRRLRRARRALGEARNCDVELARVNRILARRRTTRREAWEAVQNYLLDRRSGNFEKAVRKLGRLNLAVFYVRLKEVLASNGKHRSPRAARHLEEPGPQHPELFEKRVAASLERIWSAFGVRVAESRLDSRASVIHGARIAAKRLRYLMEVIHEFDAPGSNATLAWLRNLQEHLGNWHDLEVLEQTMIEMVARPAFLRDHLELAVEIEKLITRNRRGKQVFQKRYFAMTQDGGYEQVKNRIRELLSSTPPETDD
jgi:CHAD domain-containing protein